MNTDSEKNVRLNSEKKIEDDDFRLKVGTINKNNPEAIYFEGGTFISPKENKLSYSQEISNMKRSMTLSLRSNLKDNNYFTDRYILDFNISLNGISYNKKSYLSFQVIVRQNPSNIISLKELKSPAAMFINNVVYDLKDSIKGNYFTLSKTKR